MFNLLTAFFGLFMIGSSSTSNDSIRLHIYPTVEEAKALKASNPKEFARKMKARQEVYNIGKSWEEL